MCFIRCVKIIGNEVSASVGVQRSIKMKKRNFWKMCCLSITLCVLIAGMQGQTASAQDSVKIGVLGPLTVPTGQGIRNAAEMAAEEINAKGGILGKPVQLLFSDTQLKPDIGAYGYVKFAKEDKVAAVIGCASSEVALAVMEHIARYKVPFLVTGTAGDKLTEQVAGNYDKYRYFFRVCHKSGELAEFTSDWIIAGLVKPRHIRRAAMMIENAVWTRPIAKKWEESLKAAGADILVSEYFYKETKDFMPILSKIAAAEAELICVVSAHVNAADYVSAWAGMKGPIITGIAASFSNIWKDSEGKALSVSSVSFPGVVGVSQEEKLFNETYMKKYKVIPEYTSSYTYDAMSLLKAAAEKANSTEPDLLNDALEKSDYMGVAGRWVFDRTSHHSRFGPGYRQLMMIQWQHKGKLCAVWPQETKTCDYILPPWYEK